MSPIENLNVEDVSHQETQETQELNESLPEFTDANFNYEAVLTQVVEKFDAKETPEPLNQEEISEIAKALDVDEGTVKLLSDIMMDTSKSMDESTSPVFSKDNIAYGYCTFAGCEGTCRGCAGRR